MMQWADNKLCVPRLALWLAVVMPLLWGTAAAQCPSIDYAQRSTYAPYVSARWDTVTRCDGSGIWLKAASVVTSASFNGTYTVQAIPYNPPHPFNTGTQLFINEDDIFADSIILPFGFCFFGQTYGSACVGANGVIAMGGRRARSFCEYDYHDFSPIPNTRFPIKNAIYGIYEDIDPAHGNTGVSNRGIYQAVLGEYPCRKLCVSWNGIAQYGRILTARRHYSTYQIVLHEGTNIIDVYVSHRGCCSSTNEGYGTIGIQNSAGTSAFAAPGRNGWTGDVTTPEAWRFVPQGPLNYTITWYRGTDTSAARGVVVGRGDSVFVAPQSPTTYTARLTYMACSGLNYDLVTTVTVGIDTCRARLTASRDTVCPGQQVTLNVVNDSCAHVTAVRWNNSSTQRSITVTPARGNLYTAEVSYHNNCRSTLSKSIVVNDTMVVVSRDTVVENQLPWTHRGVSYSGAVSNVVRPYTDMGGCPVNELYSLHVWLNVRSFVDSMLCENSLPLLWNGVSFASGGTSTVTLPGAACHGEDSIVVMRVHVSSNSSSRVLDTVVEGALPYTYNGVVCRDSVSHLSVTVRNAAGCDSVIDYSLYVHRNVYDTVDSTVCEGSLPLRWNGVLIGPEGWGRAVLQAHTGADSVVVMRLNVLHNSSAVRRDTIVENRLPWQYLGRVFGAPVQHSSIVIANAAGCDSVIDYNLHVWRNVRRRADSTVCRDRLPLVWNGHRFESNAPRDARFTMQHDDTLAGAGWHGVDSTVEMHLTVNGMYDMAVSDSICTGEVMRFCGDDRDSSGTYVCRLTSTAGCDSVVTLSLTVRTVTYGSVSDTIAERQVPFARNGFRLDAVPGGRHAMPEWDTAATVSVINSQGCDSVINYTLHVHLNSRDTVDSVRCANQLPLRWGGVLFSRAGSGNDTLPSANGADSVVTRRLSLKDTSSTVEAVEACDRYTWRNGRTYSSSVEGPSVTLRNMLGCDSVISLSLTIQRTQYVMDSVLACDSVQWIDGNTYKASLTGPRVTLQGGNGCDSIVTLWLRISPTKHTDLADTFCENETYRFGARQTLTHAGVYYDTLATRRGCDSTVTLRLAMHERPVVDIASRPLCRGGVYMLTATSDVPYTLWSSSPHDPSLDDHENQMAVTVCPTTTTVYSLFADYGATYTCPAVKSVTLEPLASVAAVFEVSPTFLTYSNRELTAIDHSHNNTGRNWYVNGEWLSDRAHLHYLSLDDDSVVVMLEAYNSSCSDTSTRVVAVRKYTLYVPNAFTPDGESNRTFGVLSTGMVDFDLQIYARNGIRVFHTNNAEERWDGTYEGNPCPQGAYTYIIHYRHVGTDAAVQDKSGTVLLLR